MRRRAAGFLFAALLCAACSRGDESPLPPGFGARPWLEDAYAFTETHDFSREKMDPRRAGAYAVGNGRAFALVGLAAPLWTWSNLYGATYQEPPLGNLSMSLREGDGPVALPRQSLRWVRRSGVVAVTASGRTLEVETADFAPASAGGWDNPAALVRLVRVRNRGERPLRDVALEFRLSGGVHRRASHGAFFTEQPKKKAKARTFWKLASLSGSSRALPNGLRVGVGNLEPGEDRTVAVALAASGTPRGLDDVWKGLARKGPWRLLDETRDAWAAWFSSGVQFSGDRKLCDLFEVESGIFKVQQAAGGCFSPLIGYSYAWIRDHNGPVRWFLKSGHPEEASSAIDFFPRLAAAMGALPNSVRVDADLRPRTKDLSGVGVEHAETPNWVVLQHWWRYLADGDLEKVKAHWPLLKRCLGGQVETDGKFLFHRDETYLWCLESRTFPHVGYPNDELTTYAYSVDSSFDFVAAADRLAFLARRLGKDTEADEIQKRSDRVRAAAVSVFWDERAGYWRPAQSLLGPVQTQPFANILLNPFWCGFARPEGDPLGATEAENERAGRSLEAGYRFLGRDDGFWRTTPSLDYFVGMNAGQLLYSLLEARSPLAEGAYEAVWRCASPSGEFSEMYDGSYRPYNPDSWGPGTSGRVRPWEGGLDTEALLHYVTGFSCDAASGTARFAPHLPAGQDAFGAEGLRVGESRVDFHLSGDGTGGRAASVSLRAGPPLDVRLALWDTGRKIANVSSDRPVSFLVEPSSNGGRQAVAVFRLEPGASTEVRWKLSGALPGESTRAPKKETYEPPPYVTEDAEAVLFTSPSAVLSSLQPIAPRSYARLARSEVAALEATGLRVSVVDMDLPLRASDVAAALMDPKGRPRARVAVFGRGAFSPGKHDFKPEAFWEDPLIEKAVKAFVAAGGSILFGPEARGFSRVPQWMRDWTGGAWSTSDSGGGASETLRSAGDDGPREMDSLHVGDANEETAHQAAVEGPLWTEKKEGPVPGVDGAVTEESGRGFSGSYTFAMKALPGAPHRLRVLVHASHPVRGLALQVERDGRWVQAGVRTRDIDPAQGWAWVHFDLPGAWVGASTLRLRLIPKGVGEAHAYLLNLSAPGAGTRASLSEVLGWKGALGEAPRSWIPGASWRSIASLSGDPDASVCLALREGDAFLFKTELGSPYWAALARNLADPVKVQALRDAWEKPHP